MKDNIKTIKWIYNKIKKHLFILLIIVLIGSLSSLCSVGIAVTSKKMVDSAIGKEYNSALRHGLVFALLIFSLLFLHSMSSRLSIRITESLSNNIRLDIFKRLSSSDWISFSKYHSEDFLTRMTSDTSVVVNGVTNVLPGMIALGVQLIAAFVTLFSVDQKLGLLSFILGPISLLFYKMFSKKLRSLHINIQEKEGLYRAVIHESIQNMLVVKAFSMESNTCNRINELQKERLGYVLKKNKISIFANLSFSTGYWAGYFLAFSWGTYRLSQGLATFGSLTLFLQLVSQVQTPFIGLARSVPQLVSTSASASRLIELDSIKSESFNDIKQSLTAAGIQFENVSFAYSVENPIIKQASFKINPGEIIGLVGPSGEGKTTIIRLLLALLKEQEGRIYYTNGNEKINVSASCRSFISYVPQGNTLFSGTIAENLLIADPQATLDEMIDVLCKAGAWEYIQLLPEGLNTKIGEKALRLSEGEAQRIAIARALLKKSAVLLLDEATSALDSKTELHVLHSISKLKPARTCIIITHRPSALKICNRVFSLQDGIVTEKEHNKTI